MPIHRLFERYSALLMLGWLMLTSYLQGTGVASLAGAALGGGAPARSRRIRPSAPTPREPTANAIIERNPFDSVTGPLGHTTPPIALADPLSAPQCDSPQVVIVTEAEDPNWSVAALQTDLDLTPRDYRVGDRVAGRTIALIGYNSRQNTPSVWLSGASGLCQSSLFIARPPLPLPLDLDRSEPLTLGYRID